MPLSLTTLGPFSLIANMALALGLKPRRFKGDTASALLAHLRALPRRTVVICDEAHLLPDASLEDLRLLTADEFDRRSPFSMVLCGQPILRDRLTDPRHYALTQRIGVRIRLRPLTEAEVGLFIARHLQVAGASRAVFEPPGDRRHFPAHPGHSAAGPEPGPGLGPRGHGGRERGGRRSSRPAGHGGPGGPVKYPTRALLRCLRRKARGTDFWLPSLTAREAWRLTEFLDEIPGGHLDGLRGMRSPNHLDSRDCHPPPGEVPAGTTPAPFDIEF